MAGGSGWKVWLKAHNVPAPEGLGLRLSVRSTCGCHVLFRLRTSSCCDSPDPFAPAPLLLNDLGPMSLPSPASGAVAVVGMAGRFPGARDIRQYWRNLCDARESVVRFSDAELRASGEDPVRLADPAYVRAGAPLDGIDLFDAGFFGFSAREAAILDPQHRQFLEVCWEALEDAGHVPQTFDGAIGVFAGAGMHDYYVHHLAPNRRLMRDVGAFLVRHTGNDKDFLTTRVSYCLDLTGPSIGVQTACSTSLVAIHLAAQSLLNGECDMALAGGVTIVLPDRLGYVHRDGEILSPDGHCRPFDRDARGTLFGSGAGVVVLRRAEDAIRDGDLIHALIRGSAVNNDGRGKVSYLAPSLEGQARCAAEALAVAGVAGSSIGYVEAHGTGTPVGDPIEVAALTQAYGYDPAAPWRCRLGSVKGNVGHLDVAAGVASFIKATLALEHGAIPPSLHFTAANPECRFDDGPFRVAADLTPWPGAGAPRRAAVNSLGVGGTNAHVILEAAPPRAIAPAAPGPQILCLSARSPSAVYAAALRLAGFLREQPGVALADVAHTLQVGRRAFPHRRAVVARDVPDAIAQLETTVATATAAVPDASPPVVFMFPGGGAQYPGMGRELYAREPAFRAHLDDVLRIAELRHGHDVRRWLFPAPADAAAAPAALETAAQSLLATFAIEYAMAQHWRAQGIEPAALIGHSLGEIVAACVAGVFGLDDAVAIVAARAAILDRLPPGATMVVALGERDLAPLLRDGVSLAAVNGPALCVVSGAAAAITALEADLARQDVEARRLRLAFAAHSHLLDGYLDDFAAAMAGVRFGPPALPIVSNLTGNWADGASSSADYWVRHLRQTVRFADGLARVTAELPGCVLLETGPGTTLTSLAGQLPTPRRARTAVGAMPHQQDPTPETEVLLGALGRLWTAGVAIDWQRNGAPGRRIQLPTYPFEHGRHWIERPAAAAVETVAPAPAGRDPDGGPPIDDWFWIPEWTRAEPPSAEVGAATWLVFDDEASPQPAICAGLRARGDRVVRVVPGGVFDVRADGTIAVRPGERTDYGRLVTELSARHALPTRVAHLWGLTSASGGGDPLDAAIEESFLSPVYFVQAWNDSHGALPLHLAVVSSGVHRVGDEPIERAERAVSLGPTQVIPLEYPSISCSNIDWRPTGTPAAVDDLVAELRAAAPVPVAVWRQRQRWTPSHRRYRPQTAGQAGLIRRRGVYLITGGFGGLGLALAEHLAREYEARLILVGRSIPDRAVWPDLLAGGDALAARLGRVVALERADIEVLTLGADAADSADMAAVAAAVVARFGGLDGIFHAAGVIDDQPIALKSRASAAAVLRPKLQGIRGIRHVVERTRPTFVALFSSVSAVIGVPGQVDYSAANAYLNAVAGSAAAGGPQTFAIDWAAWRDVGMAADLLAQSRGQAVAHPLLGRRRPAGLGRVVFTADWRADELWVLNEHRVRGQTAVLPGTAYLEMLRAAGCSEAPDQTISVEDLLLVAPLTVADGETMAVRLDLEVAEPGRSWRATVSSRPRPDAEWTEHARGLVRAGTTPAPRRIDVPALAAACADRQIDAGPGWRSLQERHLHLGGRWRSVQHIGAGRDEALIHLQLGAPFAADFETALLHPAMVDQAIGAALALLTPDDARESFFVPLACARARIWRGLPPTLQVHVRRATADEGAVAFDLTIADEHGEVCAVVDQFVLVALDSARVFASRGSASRPMPRPPDTPSPLEQLLASGIDTAGGLAALDRLLAASHLPPVIVVSPIPVAAIEQQLAPRQVRLERRSRAAGGGQRPRTATEEVVARTWAAALGTDDIDVDDNWFELGGHSLLGLRVLAQMRRAFGVDLTPQFFFDAPTIAAQSAAIGAIAGSKEIADGDRIVPVDREQFRRLRGSAR